MFNLKTVLLIAFGSLFSTLPVLAERKCEPFSTFQVCWPSDDFIIFSSVQNGQALFALPENGIGRISFIGEYSGSAEELRKEYLATMNIYDGTYANKQPQSEFEALSYSFTAIQSNLLDQPKNKNHGTPFGVAILQLNGAFIIVESMFPNKYRAEADSILNDVKLETHQNFISYVLPL